MTDVTTALRAAAGTMPDGSSTLINVKWMRQAAGDIERLRAALGNLLNCIDGQHEPEHLERCKVDAKRALAISSTLA
jgi:hypothetical protein